MTNINNTQPPDAQIVEFLSDPDNISEEERQAFLKKEMLVKATFDFAGGNEYLKAYEMGKVLSEMKGMDFWHTDKCFLLASGNLEKKPKFSKWIKNNKYRIGEEKDWKVYNNYLKEYEKVQKQIKNYEDKLAKLRLLDEYSRRFDQP